MFIHYYIQTNTSLWRVRHNKDTPITAQENSVEINLAKTYQCNPSSDWLTDRPTNRPGRLDWMDRRMIWTKVVLLFWESKSDLWSQVMWNRHHHKKKKIQRRIIAMTTQDGGHTIVLEQHKTEIFPAISCNELQISIRI